MQAIVEISLNSNTNRVIATLIEGIEYSEIHYRRPNATNPNWSLKMKINVSPDNLLNVSCMAVGRSLHKAEAKIVIQYRKNNTVIEKSENIEDDTFSERSGILIFKKEISL